MFNSSHPEKDRFTKRLRHSLLVVLSDSQLAEEAGRQLSLPRALPASLLWDLGQAAHEDRKLGKHSP